MEEWEQDMFDAYETVIKYKRRKPKQKAKQSFSPKRGKWFDKFKKAMSNSAASKRGDKNAKQQKANNPVGEKDIRKSQA